MGRKEEGKKERRKEKEGKRKKERESRSEEKEQKKRPDFLFGKSDLYTLKSPKKISVED